MSRYGDVAFDGARYDIELPVMVSHAFDSSLFDYSCYGKVGSFGYDRCNFDVATYDARTLTGFDISPFSAARPGFNYSKYDQSQFEEVTQATEGFDRSTYGDGVLSSGFSYATYDASSYNSNLTPLPGSHYDTNPYEILARYDEIICYDQHALTVAEEVTADQHHAFAALLETMSDTPHILSNTEIIITNLHLLSAPREIFAQQHFLLQCLPEEVDLD